MIYFWRGTRCHYLSVKLRLISLDTMITFHINAMSDDVAKKVRAELRCQVSNMLMAVPVVHDVIPRLSQQVLADIAKLESSNVHIDIGKFCLSFFIITDKFNSHKTRRDNTNINYQLRITCCISVVLLMKCYVHEITNLAFSR